MNGIIDFFAHNFESCVWLAVLIVAMIPTLESKIAIPLAMNSAIWGANAISPISAFLLAFLGSILPCYFAMLLSRRIKKHTALVLHSKFLQKYAIRGAQMENQGELKKYVALAGFVSIPLPLTGVWSGSLIGGLSNLKIHYCFLSIAVGAFISAGAITLLCSLFNNSISAIFMISLILINIFMLIDLISHYIKPQKNMR